ncbi:hypothetical protein JOM56_008665 [Amanita muscaria]
MPRFNIFKAFSKNNNPDQSKESKALDRAVSTPEQPFQGDTTNDRPSRKPKTLTKRRPSVSQVPVIQPSYSISIEDLGFHDSGRYPFKGPESILANSSNPANHRDTHPRFVEDTRLEYPTTNNESFHPRGQSSKRWSPVPDVYREPPTEEYEDNTGPVGEPPGPHYHQPQRGHGRDTPLPTRPRHSPDKRRRRRSEPGNGSQRSDNGTVGMDTRYEHTTEQDRSREMPSNARLGDTTGIRYVRDNVHDGALQQGVSMPVVFEHEVLREDGDPNPKIWHYIVPGGLDVIFKDEDGNELTRVKNTGGRSSKRRITPMIIEDEDGNVIHRMGDFDSEADDSQTRSDTDHRRREYPYESRYQKSGKRKFGTSCKSARIRSDSPTGHVYTSYLSPEADKVFLIDEHGRQIPIADRKKRSSARRKHPHGYTGR